jgi:hypothetical protein
VGGLVEPYKRRPDAPTVAVLTADGDVIDEHGSRLELDRLPERTRVWASYDTARMLVLDGRGEGLCWNGEEIRWRHRRFEEGWKRRPSDVNVIKLPFPADPARALRGLVGWRDWLRSYGASPTGTSGGAAWSLLRARLTAPLWLGVGTRPPIRQTLGGRQELGEHGPGRVEGRLELFDLPAAYASELGHLPYGGRWYEVDELPIDQPPEWWARDNRAVFVRAKVKVPAGGLGPLPRRPREQLHGMGAFLLGAEYPAGRLQGVWTWQELEAAQLHGARILSVLGVWVHVAPTLPFLPWWDAIVEGRRQPGLAGLLAKVTGNALWGRFCMDARTVGERSIRSRQGRKVVMRPLPFPGGLPPSHDLAETVSGRVRARLYRVMAAAGGGLVSAHTDGAWIDVDRVDAGELEPAVEGWRVKEKARRIDVLNPQVLRYWPTPPRFGGGPAIVFAGVPFELAERAFVDAWDRAGFTP